MGLKFNPTTGKLDLVGDGGAAPSPIPADTGEPTGFFDRVATLSWAAGTFTITGDHDIYITGTKYAKTTDTLSITGDGQHFIIYNTSGVLEEVAGWYLGDGPICTVAAIYIDGANALVQDERHGITMDWQTHHYLHDTRGCAYGNGGGFTDDGAGEFILGDYDLYDEDIEAEQPQANTCVMLARAYADSVYLGRMTIVDMNWGRADYRVINATVYDDNGTFTPAGVNGYVCQYLYGTTLVDKPCVIVMGRAVYNTLALARAEAPDNQANLDGLYAPEFKLFYKIIVRNQAIVEFTDYRTVSAIPGVGVSPSSHDVLSGRSLPSQHPATSIDYGTGTVADALDAMPQYQHKDFIGQFQLVSFPTARTGGETNTIADLPVEYTPDSIYYDELGNRGTFSLGVVADDIATILDSANTNYPPTPGVPDSAIYYKLYYYNTSTYTIDIAYFKSTEPYPTGIPIYRFGASILTDGDNPWYLDAIFTAVTPVFATTGYQSISGRHIYQSKMGEYQFGIWQSGAEDGLFTVIGQLEPDTNNFVSYECVGTQSASLGYYLRPFGQKSVAIGNTARTGFPISTGLTSSQNQVAIASRSRAYQSYCIAIGQSAVAGADTFDGDSQHDNSIAIGAESQSAMGGVAVGPYANASFGGIVIGPSTTGGTNSMALGFGLTALDNEVKIGASGAAVDFVGTTLTFNGNPIGGGGITSIEFADLATLVAGNGLTVGARYLLTDFRTRCLVANAGNDPAYMTEGPTEALLLTAKTDSTFEEQAYSSDFPQDIIYYAMYPDAAFGYETYADRGAIYYRHDTALNIKAWHDWRNAKIRLYRRLENDDTSWVKTDQGWGYLDTFTLVDDTKQNSNISIDSQAGNVCIPTVVCRDNTQKLTIGASIDPCIFNGSVNDVWIGSCSSLIAWGSVGKFNLLGGFITLEQSSERSTFCNNIYCTFSGIINGCLVFPNYDGGGTNLLAGDHYNEFIGAPAAAPVDAINATTHASIDHTGIPGVGGGSGGVSIGLSLTMATSSYF